MRQFSVGEVVTWIPDLLLRWETHGDYRIIAAMPDQDGHRVYRIAFLTSGCEIPIFGKKWRCCEARLSVPVLPGNDACALYAALSGGTEGRRSDRARSGLRQSSPRFPASTPVI